ncbi:FecR family protein [Carboxylicivirga sp. RSCT41]|uniref:FecR family protein n=1 Tax=Carboxylicivirga agarovorans TaxID=3417570 RepID=UPI003D33C1BC
MNKSMIWELITHQLSAQKEKEVWEQIYSSPELLTQYKEMKRIWSLSGNNQVLPTETIDRKYKEFSKQHMGRNTDRRLLFTLVKYAAVLIVAFASSYALWMLNDSRQSNYQAVHTYETGNGSTNTITLSDGSQIWLNANSSIDIQKADKQCVELKLEGEALFDIIHNEERRFIINAQSLKIEDLGTRFNVRNFKDDDHIVATLIEGEIMVSHINRQFNEVLVPGQQINYSKVDGRYTIEHIDTSYVGSWKESKFEFVDKSLADIALDLENWYGVSITFKNKALEKERFTGVIQKSTSVEKVLDVIAYTAGIKYSINQTNDSTEIMIQ